MPSVRLRSVVLLLLLTLPLPACEPGGDTDAGTLPAIEANAPPANARDPEVLAAGRAAARR